MKEKLIINLNYKPKPIFFVIFLLIITLGLSPPVYTNSRQKELKGKSNSSRPGLSTQSRPQNRSSSSPSGKISRPKPQPRVENKNSSRNWGYNSPNQDRSNKLGRSTGRIIRKSPPRIQPDPIPEPPKTTPGKPKPPGKRQHHNRYWCPGGYIGRTTYDANEEYLESPDSEYPPTSRESDRYTARREREYHINDSFIPDQMLVEKIDEYNATHPHSLGLEYPLTTRSESLTIQLLDSLELIERMEKKLQYYKQQLDLVRNSNLSPVERSKRELFWLERIDRLQESKQKMEKRVFELRSAIEEEHRK
jgi:hypothetical protein